MKKNILVVDDIEFNIEFEEKVIKSLMDELDIGVQIDSAYTVTDALEKIEKNDPYDAIIIDMNLPDGTGTTIAKAARSKSDHTRTAALTIYPGTYEHERAFFDLFLKKPIMPDSYKQNLARLLYL